MREINNQNSTWEWTVRWIRWMLISITMKWPIVVIEIRLLDIIFEQRFIHFNFDSFCWHFEFFLMFVGDIVHRFDLHIEFMKRQYFLPTFYTEITIIWLKLQNQIQFNLLDLICGGFQSIGIFLLDIIWSVLDHIHPKKKLTHLLVLLQFLFEIYTDLN